MERATRAMRTSTTTARIVKTRVARGAKEPAAPEFRKAVKVTAPPSRCRGSWPSTTTAAIAFVIWSTANPAAATFQSRYIRCTAHLLIASSFTERTCADDQRLRAMIDMMQLWPITGLQHLRRSVRPAGPEMESKAVHGCLGATRACRYGSGSRSRDSGSEPEEVQIASSRANSSGVRIRSAAAAESTAVAGRLEPGIGITTGEVASIQARQTRWGLTP